jgi:hypothetical protein
MSDVELADHTWWAWLWTTIEHGAFVGLIVALAIEFAALKLAEPHKKALEDAKDLKLGELSRETQRLSTEGDIARRETAEAKLQLEQMRSLAGPRDINFEVFKKELEGKSKALVAIWYLPDSSDGYWFASRLRVALGISGWQVEGYGPKPIPEPDQNNMLTRDMPRAVVAGGQSMGVTVVGDAPMGTSPDPNTDTPFNWLFKALARSTAFGMYGSSGSQFMPVPEGTLRVVVAAKADPIFGPPAAATPPK